MLQEVCIWNTDAEGYESTNVSKNRILHIFLNLGHKLIGNNQVQSVLTCFRKNDGKIFSCVVLEFIDIQVEIFTLFHRDILTTHGSRQNLGHENQSQKLGILFSKFAFRKIDEQDLLLIHDLSEVKGALALSNDVAHHFVGNEFPELRYDVVQNFRFMEITGLGNLVRPVAPDHRVFDLRQKLLNILRICQTAHELDKGTSRLCHDGQHCIADGVLKSWTDNTGLMWIIEL